MPTPETDDVGVMPKQAFTQLVAAYFKSRPGVWVDGRELSKVGGSYAWRSRVSDCRLELGMEIQNRQRRIICADGSRFTISEYRYGEQAPSFELR